MADLREALTAAWFGDVLTYIQSGNVVLNDPGDPATFGTRFDEALSAADLPTPAKIARSVTDLTALIDTCPFGSEDPSRVQALLFDGDPRCDADRLNAAATPSERWNLSPGALWLHCPDGFGRSRLATTTEKALGVPATGRNLRTLRAVRGLATDDS